MEYSTIDALNPSRLGDSRVLVDRRKLSCCLGGAGESGDQVREVAMDWASRGAELD